jgi:hypothetical protein
MKLFMKPILGILCAAGLLCPSAHATTLIFLDPATVLANQGAIGDTVDVVLTNSGPGSISIQSFSFQVSVTDPDITFTGAGFSTAASPYIFAGDSFDVINGFTLNTDASGQTMNGSDGTNDGAGVTLTAGESLALGELFFNASPTAAFGGITVSFTGGAAANNLSDPAGDNVAIGTFTSGTINVTSTPEPSSFLLILAGTAALGAWNRRRRRA